MARGCSVPLGASLRPCQWAGKVDVGHSADLRLPPIRSRQARSRMRSTSTGKPHCSVASPISQEAQRFQKMIEVSRLRLLSEGPSVPSRIQLICDDEEAAVAPIERRAPPVFPITGDACVWVSVNPRSGKLQLYPRSAAERLEEAYFRRRKCAALCGLGLDRRLEEAIVHLDGESFVQRTRRGARDVRRLELGRLGDLAGIPTVEVINGENGWRICDATVEGVSQIRCLPSDWTTDAIAVQKLWQPLPPPRHRMAATF